jgi:hypothetical protein
MDPFIEAEEAAGHSIKHCCELFVVSRAACYERKKDVPSQRELGDAELREKIIAVHSESKGTYGSPRLHQELVKRGGCLRAAPGAPPGAPSWSCGTVQVALAQDDGARPGRREGKGPDPAPLRPVR